MMEYYHRFSGLLKILKKDERDYCRNFMIGVRDTTVRKALQEKDYSSGMNMHNMAKHGASVEQNVLIVKSASTITAAYRKQQSGTETSKSVAAITSDGTVRPKEPSAPSRRSRRSRGRGASSGQTGSASVPAPSAPQPPTKTSSTPTASAAKPAPTRGAPSGRGRGGGGRGGGRGGRRGGASNAASTAPASVNVINYEGPDWGNGLSGPPERSIDLNHTIQAPGRFNGYLLGDAIDVIEAELPPGTLEGRCAGCLLQGHDWDGYFSNCPSKCPFCEHKFRNARQHRRHVITDCWDKPSDKHLYCWIVDEWAKENSWSNA